jgi:4-azaleucine resistance transporter AzlC
MSGSRSYFIEGARTALPILPGIAPFGLVAGIAAVESGLSPFIAVFMSLTIFAGASQFAAIQLIAAGAAPVVILLTVLVINLRFAMYSASLAPHLAHLGLARRLLAGFLVVDQVFAMAIVRYRSMPVEGKFPYYFGLGAPIWLVWQLTTAAGAFLGAKVPDSWSLEFTIPLMFLALLIISIRNAPMVVAAVVGGLVATLAQGMPFKLGIITGALSGIVAGFVSSRFLRARGSDS